MQQLYDIVETLNQPMEDGGSPFANEASMQQVLASISRNVDRVSSTVNVMDASNYVNASVMEAAHTTMHEALGDLLFDSFVLLHTCARERNIRPELVWRDTIARVQQRAPDIPRWGDAGMVETSHRTPLRVKTADSPTPSASASVSSTPNSLERPGRYPRGELAVQSDEDGELLRCTVKRDIVRDFDKPALEPLSPMKVHADALHWDSRCTIIAPNMVKMIDVRVPRIWGSSPHSIFDREEKEKSQVFALSWTFSCMNDIRFRLSIVKGKNAGNNIDIIEPCEFVGGR